MGSPAEPRAGRPRLDQRHQGRGGRQREHQLLGAHRLHPTADVAHELGAGHRPESRRAKRSPGRRRDRPSGRDRPGFGARRRHRPAIICQTAIIPRDGLRGDPRASAPGSARSRSIGAGTWDDQACGAPGQVMIVVRVIAGVLAVVGVVAVSGRCCARWLCLGHCQRAWRTSLSLPCTGCSGSGCG